MSGVAGNGSGGGLSDRTARVREVFHRRPTVGVGPAAKQVVEDAKTLIQAEIALAKAEVSKGVRAKGIGMGLMGAAAILGWLGLQGLLITAGFALAIVLPAWAAALIVTAVLLLLAGIAALIGKRQLSVPVTVEATKQNVEEDVAWTKAHLPKPQPPSGQAPTPTGGPPRT